MPRVALKLFLFSLFFPIGVVLATTLLQPSNLVVMGIAKQLPSRPAAFDWSVMLVSDSATGQQIVVLRWAAITTPLRDTLASP